ncbi:AraC family transcriptional regulator [Micromonospora sp. DT53]|uniref:helix-turn-helix transcriptional regulator n=1 Tax=Micromonospora sp. DT53 TaxID=3393444 RepID=UPI003CF72E26
MLLVGAYHVRGRVPQRLLGALPPVLVVPEDQDCAALRDYLDAQLDAGRPGRPWTLASLAAQAEVSRSTLAKRFTALVGEPPLTYLTDWRMTLAADMLAESTATVAAVARHLGYADAFGFSAAFKRVHGMSPSGHRRLTRVDAPAA